MTADLSPDAWAQIRYDYEHTERPIPDICIEHGISAGTLRDRMRRWGWTRRRPPIPAEGPAAVPSLYPSAASGDENRGEYPSLVSAPTLPSSALAAAKPEGLRSGEAGSGGGTKGESAGEIEEECGGARETDTAAAPEDDAIVPRLQGAVARVLPAIEANLATLGAGTMHPRELEQTARALGTLTRTLRELNRLLAEHQPQAFECECRDTPEVDIETFRLNLARQMDAVIASRKAREARQAEAQDT